MHVGLLISRLLNFCRQCFVEVWTTCSRRCDFKRIVLLYVCAVKCILVL